MVPLLSVVPVVVLILVLVVALAVAAAIAKQEKALRRAVAVAPRGRRATELLEIRVGTQRLAVPSKKFSGPPKTT